MPIQRAFPTLLTTDLPAARAFYVDLLGFTPAFDSDWFLQLRSPGGAELGVLLRDHDLVPEALRAATPGDMLTVVVEDVEPVFAAVVAAGVEVVEPPRDLFYGQRRALLRDPDGRIIDLSSPTAPRP